MNILLPIVYAGNIAYYRELNLAQQVCLEKHEHYIKQTYRNRCTIYGANGKLDLIIPVAKSKSAHQPVHEVKINYDQNWQRLHWKSLGSAYRSSPYFEHYEHEFEPFYQKKFEFLIDFNLALHQTILRLLELDINSTLTTAYEAKPANFVDKRYLAEPTITTPELKPYTQVFELQHGFIGNLSVLDLLFNCGPHTGESL